MRIFLGFSIDFCYEYQIKNETIWICYWYITCRSHLFDYRYIRLWIRWCFTKLFSIRCNCQFYMITSIRRNHISLTRKNIDIIILRIILTSKNQYHPCILPLANSLSYNSNRIWSKCSFSLFLRWSNSSDIFSANGRYLFLSSTYKCNFLGADNKQ